MNLDQASQRRLPLFDIIVNLDQQIVSPQFPRYLARLSLVRGDSSGWPPVSPCLSITDIMQGGVGCRDPADTRITNLPHAQIQGLHSVNDLCFLIRLDKVQLKLESMYIFNYDH